MKVDPGGLLVQHQIPIVVVDRAGAHTGALPMRRHKDMTETKKLLSLDEIESQTALELPRRELPALINVITVTGDILSYNNVAVAAQVCGVQVTALALAVAQFQRVTCDQATGQITGR
jgi:hypothetical protein